MSIAAALCAGGVSYCVWLAFQPTEVRPRIFLLDTYSGDEIFGIELWPVFCAVFLLYGLNL